jgi:hypothetical protein
MPPNEARQLDPAVRAELVQYLKKAEFSDADTAMLENAAALGMARGAEGATQ